jgi:hypothetical protein
METVLAVVVGLTHTTIYTQRIQHIPLQVSSLIIIPPNSTQIDSGRLKKTKRKGEIAFEFNVLNLHLLLV